MTYVDKNTKRLSQAGLVLALVAALSACTAIHPPEAYMPNRSGIEAGETVTVKGNENIYVIAHEHNVSMRELIVLNNLKAPYEVRPGQTLQLPVGGSSFSGEMKPPAPAPLDPVEKNYLSPIEPSGVTSQALQPVAPAPAVAPLPTPQTKATSSPQVLVVSPPPPAPAPTVVQTSPLTTTTEPVAALNHPTPVPPPTATTTNIASVVPPAAAFNSDGPVSMAWPVQGPILSGFGSKGAGLNNDGINIGAPKGAPVVAAAPGTVVYAGDEMKGFGNLVLIRHQGDWVTAYAHLERVLVKKDSIVAQGDMIGTVGKTGNVATPQLHFETRQNGKPVDPSQVIKNNP